MTSSSDWLQVSPESPVISEDVMPMPPPTYPDRAGAAGEGRGPGRRGVVKHDVIERTPPAQLITLRTRLRGRTPCGRHVYFKPRADRTAARAEAFELVVPVGVAAVVAVPGSRLVVPQERNCGKAREVEIRGRWCRRSG